CNCLRSHARKNRRPESRVVPDVSNSQWCFETMGVDPLSLSMRQALNFISLIHSFNHSQAAALAALRA
ncbi:hypothetical protein, partial [Bradyrhizobium sp.]|uniref:hypothetical protein n=1 Tax=Bradyrhizobium sp. TaxID=376 RepID=UPI0025B7FC55